MAITASSSESCSFLFKLLCDPGDAVLIPEPSYPLYDYLVRLEGAVPIPYRLTFDGVWGLDFASIEQALGEARGRGARARAIVVASPNNPTGGFVKRDEADRLADIAARGELAIVADEVFAPYPLGPIRPGSRPPRSRLRWRPPRPSSASAGCRSRAVCRT